MITEDCFKVSHSDTYYGIEFIYVPQSFKKYCNFYGYSIHKDHISKHYQFEISWNKISDDEEFVKKIKNNDDINQPFKNIEYLFKSSKTYLIIYLKGMFFHK